MRRNQGQKKSTASSTTWGNKGTSWGNKGTKKKGCGCGQKKA